MLSIKKYNLWFKSVTTWKQWTIRWEQWLQPSMSKETGPNTLLVLHRIVVSSYLHHHTRSIIPSIFGSRSKDQNFTDNLHIPIFMAGGRTYWINSTKRNRGSEGTNPKCEAAFTTPIPTPGSIMYLTQMTVTIEDDFNFALRNPASVYHCSVNFLVFSTKKKAYIYTLC